MGHFPFFCDMKPSVAVSGSGSGQQKFKIYGENPPELTNNLFHYTLNALTLSWLAESVQWIFEISARDVITADYNNHVKDTQGYYM